MAMMGITGVMKFTPTKSLETLVSILSIDLDNEQEAMTTAIRPVFFLIVVPKSLRHKNVECWNDNTYGHANFPHSKKDQVPEPQMLTDKPVPQSAVDSNTRTSTF